MKWTNRQFLDTARDTKGVLAPAMEFINHIEVEGKSVLVSTDGYRMHMVWANPDGSELRAGNGDDRLGLTQQQVEAGKKTFTMFVDHTCKDFTQHNPDFCVALPIDTLRGMLEEKEGAGFILFDRGGLIHVIQQDQWEKAVVIAEKWRRVEGKMKIITAPFHIHINLNYLYDALTPYRDGQVITISKAGGRDIAPYGIGHWGRRYAFVMPLQNVFRELPNRLKNYLATGEIK